MLIAGSAVCEPAGAAEGTGLSGPVAAAAGEAVRVVLGLVAAAGPGGADGSSRLQDARPRVNGGHWQVMKGAARCAWAYPVR
jgi:hypothetical protein